MPIRLLVTLFVFVAGANSTSFAAEKPNIVFIMVDDLGKDWIGCYGADEKVTPNIDALAAGGLKFDNAYSMPQCTPTRVTLLTGRYPYRTGWVNHWDVPRWGVGYFDWRKEVAYPRLLKQAGYATAIAGKWQINDFRVEPEALEKHGFDDWCVWTGFEAGNKPSGERYWDPYIHTRAGSKTYKGEFGPDLYCDFLIEFLKEHRDEPQMLYFPMALTHGPLVPTPDEPNVTEKKDKMRAMVRYTDKLVGRIVAALDETGLRKKTIVVFTTDNGSGGGQRGTIGGVRPTGGKASNYEGGVCEPFVVNCPGTVAAGAETDALVDFSDLLPTFCELAGADVPADVEIDGRSFAPLVLGKADDSPREWILAMGHGAGVRDKSGVRARDDFTDRVVRDKRFKAWIGTSGKIEAVYDLKADPWERENLLGKGGEDVVAATKKFQGLLDAMPKVDARPQYTARDALPWDVPVKRRSRRGDER